MHCQNCILSIVEFVILCGGYGTRFQDVSKILPKILINISKSMTMLDWIMEEYLPINSKVLIKLLLLFFS